MAEQSSRLDEPYAVMLSKKARKGLSALVGNRKDEAEKFLAMLPNNPKIRVPGKSKKLRGEYERLGYRQYDLPDGCRIQYRIIDESKEVRVAYVGPHPK